MTDEISPDVGYVIGLLAGIETVDENQFEIIYDDEKIHKEYRLSKEQTQQQPSIKIHVEAANNKHTTLVMIDPDAPSADHPITGPFIHWILANFRQSDGSDGQHICVYMGPGPRPGTGRHRYVFLLYQSDEPASIIGTFDSIPERRKFPMSKFAEDNHFTLVGRTFFTVDA